MERTREAARAAGKEHGKMKEKKPIYQRYELEALLGEFVSNYDVDAIEEEATDTDANGNRVWIVNSEELAAIMERHDLTTPQHQPQEEHTMKKRTYTPSVEEVSRELGERYFTVSIGKRHRPHTAALQFGTLENIISMMDASIYAIDQDADPAEYSATISAEASGDSIITMPDCASPDSARVTPQPIGDTYEVRQIDAYIYDDEWTYNTTYNLGSFTTTAQNVPRAFRAALRRMGITFIKGRTRTEYDGDVWEIVDRATHEPLFAAIPKEF